jgi:2-oxo-3-hexenedioate decarboxylase
MSDLQVAFAEQLQAFRARRAAGMPRLGWKVGINVPEVQKKLGLTGPLVGWLDGERRYPCGASVPVAADAKLHVEPELCVRIARRVEPDADPAAALAAVDGIAAALELVDYAKPASDLPGVVRNCMFHHGCVLGEFRPPRADIGIAAQVSLHVDGVSAGPARADLVPAQLADLVQLVAQLLAAGGEQLEPGDHILSGCFLSQAVPLGQTAEARLGDFGTVRCTRWSREPR